MEHGSIYEEDLVFSTKSKSFSEIWCNFKERKTKSKFWSKSWTQIFVDFFTIYHNSSSPQPKQNSIISTRKSAYLLPHDLPNNLILRILGNKKISRKFFECVNMMGSTYPDTQRQLLTFLWKTRKKRAVKHSIQKVILSNLLTAFCSRLPVKTEFHFWLGLDPSILSFLEFFRIQKTNSLFRLTFRAT